MKGNAWWIDSGASQHMTPERKEMTNYENFKIPLKIKLADNSTVLAHGKGKVKLSVYDGTKRVNVTLHDVLYVPKIRNKLLSLPTITGKGAEVHFKGHNCKIMIKDESYIIEHKQGKLY